MYMNHNMDHKVGVWTNVCVGNNEVAFVYSKAYSRGRIALFVFIIFAIIDWAKFGFSSVGAFVFFALLIIWLMVCFVLPLINKPKTNQVCLKVTDGNGGKSDNCISKKDLKSIILTENILRGGEDTKLCQLYLKLNDNTEILVHQKYYSKKNLKKIENLANELAQRWGITIENRWKNRD